MKLTAPLPKRAQDNDIISGFGSNGGRRILSYPHDRRIAGGKRVITAGRNGTMKPAAVYCEFKTMMEAGMGIIALPAPVFCTATCLLILSIDKDIDF